MKINMCKWYIQFFEIVQDNTQLSKILTNKNELRPDIEKNKRFTNENTAYYALLLLLMSQSVLKAEKIKIYKISVIQSNSCTIHTLKHNHFNISSSSSCSGRIRFDSCSLYPQNETGPSISTSVVLCVFVLLVYIVVLV